MLSNSAKSLDSLANDEPQKVDSDDVDSNIGLISGAGDALEIQSSSSVPTQLVSTDSAKPGAEKGDFTRLSKKPWSSMPNIHITFGETEATEVESISMKVLDSTKPDAAKDDFTRLQKKPWSSMPNIHIAFGETEATEVESIPMKVLAEIENETKPAYDEHVYSDPITNTSHGTTTERRRRSWWKRTKKFVRRMFCCGA
jgi:hypothetical protein